MLSIIIPTLNAEDELPDALAALDAGMAKLDAVEIVVSDGGSSDTTCELARKAGAIVVAGEPGRGQQLAAGAKAASSDWLLFLHADTRLEDRWPQVVGQFMEIFSADDIEAKAAAFRYRLDDTAGVARFLEVIVELRTWWLALPYGDQGLLIARRHYDEVGGFKPIPIMEDVDIVRRIGRKRLVQLRCSAITSAARYRRDGYLKRMLRNVRCLAMWFLGVAPDKIAKAYK